MIESYVLHITKECNMQCIYCYEKDKTSTYTWQEIKKLLTDMIKYNKKFMLEFLGGEPCLRIDLIKSSIEYLESFSDVNVPGYTITTNGTIVNDELIELLKKYSKIRWAASMDGNKFMNCLRITKQGYNSYDMVMKNFKILNEALNNDSNKQLSFHLVTHPYNIAYLNDGIKDIYDQGVRRFVIGTVESTIIIDEIYCKEFTKQHQILSDKIKQGYFPDIHISLFEGLKPKSDERHYIRDKSGKVILETYGRVKGDIKDSEEYKTKPSSSNLGDMIFNIRKRVYDYHNQTS